MKITVPERSHGIGGLSLLKRSVFPIGLILPERVTGDDFGQIFGGLNRTEGVFRIKN